MKLAPISFLLIAGLATAGCASGRPDLAQVLDSPAGKADPLQAVRASGYVPDSTEYSSTKVVLDQGIKPGSSQFTKDVYNEIATRSLYSPGSTAHCGPGG